MSFCHALIEPYAGSLCYVFDVEVNELYKNKNNEIFPIEDTDLRECCISQFECTKKSIETTLAYDWNEWDCDCEYKLQKCLKNLKSKKADGVGFLRSLRVRTCMAKGYPIIRCSSYEDFMGRNRSYEEGKEKKASERCIEYIRNKNELKEFQVVDLRYYLMDIFDKILSP